MTTKRTSTLEKWRGLVLILSMILFLHALISSPSLALTWSETIAMNQTQAENLPGAVEAAVRKDVSRRTKIASNQFKLLEARRETWPDGCLGLGGPGELCTQALVEGWLVKMGYGEQVWTYRTNNTGTNLRTSDTKTNLIN